MRSKPKCRVCGARMIPIVYGLPGPGLMRKAEQGKVSLGGCCISGDGTDPEWECPKCEVLA